MTEDEFASWRDWLVKEGGDPPARGALRDAAARLASCQHYTYTADDVRRMVEAKRVALGAANPVAERVRLQALYDAAVNEGRAEDAEG